MYLRTAGNRDLETVRALLVETLHASYDALYGAARVTEITNEQHSIAALGERLTRPRSEFVLADDGREIAGMAFASADESGAAVTLHQLCVRPDQQGRGVGGLLLDEIIASFPEAAVVRLEVEAGNGRAVAFFVAQGFETVGAGSACGDVEGIRTLIMSRPILPG